MAATKKNPSNTATKTATKTAAKTAAKTPKTGGSALKPASAVKAKKAPVAKSSAKKVSPSRKTPLKSPAAKPAAKKAPVKATLKQKPAPAPKPKVSETVASVATSLSAAAKRIQEREERRKQRTAERIAATAPPPRNNGHKLPPRPFKPEKPLGAKDLQKFKNLLLEFRDRIVGDIKFLTTDNLHRMGRETGADLSGASQHSADHGTDNFDREFALSLATTEQDVLYEVDEALMRIDEGTYGFCEMTGVAIEKARLEVIPYTRFSVQAQTRMEQGRAKYRPFAQAFKSW